MFWKKKPPSPLNETMVRAHLARYDALHTAKAVILCDNGHVLITLDIDPSQATTLEPHRAALQHSLSTLTGVVSATVILTAEATTAAQPISHTTAPPSTNPQPDLSSIKQIIAVASGKGGVGKSTVAAHLAMHLAARGHTVGLLDADIYGPSVPTLFGVRGQKPMQNDKLEPIIAHGVRLMSMGFLVDEESPMVWRGPMIQKALLQFLRDVNWGTLDYLILDMPPGTGDAQLTVAQRVPLTGAIIVSTPQDIALLDTVKGVEMFRKVNVPILGLIENMSFFCCPNCNHQSEIFGHGGAEKRAQEMSIPFWGALPLTPAWRDACDKGQPIQNPSFDHIIDRLTTDPIITARDP